ncbi:hypothetical protein VTI74DRAFT_6290 [Chaetomium olivicolor]
MVEDARSRFPADRAWWIGCPLVLLQQKKLSQEASPHFSASRSQTTLGSQGGELSGMCLAEYSSGANWSRKRTAIDYNCSAHPSWSTPSFRRRGSSGYLQRLSSTYSVLSALNSSTRMSAAWLSQNRVYALARGHLRQRPQVSAVARNHRGERGAA